MAGEEGGCGSGGRGCVFEGDFGDTSLFVDFGAAGGGMLEKEVVELGADDVPCIVGCAEGNEVGVYQRSHVSI